MVYTVPPVKPLKVLEGAASCQKLKPDTDYVLEDGREQILINPSDIKPEYTNPDRKPVGLRRLHRELDPIKGTITNGEWDEGDLTYSGQGSLYRVEELPKRIPLYELDTGVRSKTNGQ
ncbi:hypothetical protein SB766_20300 [Pseudomonas sp. SIMBA_077]